MDYFVEEELIRLGNIKDEGYRGRSDNTWTFSWISWKRGGAAEVKGGQGKADGRQAAETMKFDHDHFEKLN